MQDPTPITGTSISWTSNGYLVDLIVSFFAMYHAGKYGMCIPKREPCHWSSYINVAEVTTIADIHAFIVLIYCNTFYFSLGLLTQPTQ